MQARVRSHPTRTTAIVSLAVFLSAGESLAFWHIGQGVASKWGDTAVGSGAVVTWGFVPDGTAIDPDFRIDPFGSPDSVGAVGGSNISQLRALIDGNHSAGSFDAAIRRAFDTWSAVADIEFVEVIDPGDPVGEPGSVTPNIRIGAFLPEPGHFFEGTGAVGFGPPGFILDPELDFPESGDILFNLSGNKFGGVQTPFHIAPGVEDVTPVDFFQFGDDLEGLFLHELGHAAIGLAHPVSEGLDPDQRVMYVGPGCCQSINRRLSADDIAGARFVYGLKGDYNGDGLVDAADYTVWRDTDGQTGPGLSADGDRNEAIDADDYEAWSANYGAVEVTTIAYHPDAAISTAAPEPSAWLLAALGALKGVTQKRREN